MLIVQCDFDDTITVGIVSTVILEAFAAGDWATMLEEFHAGKYSVEESNIRLFALVEAEKADIEEFILGQVVVRYAFDEFVEYCQGEGIRLVIVSSGLDLYIQPTIRQLGLDHLEIYSGHALVTPSGIEVQYTNPSGAPITRGFKESYVRHFKAEGNTVIYVGDGDSDIVPAGESDFVIARSTLEEHRKTNGLPYFSFDTFNDVGKHVEEIRQRLGQ